MFDRVFRKELSANRPILLVAFICMLFAFSAPALLIPFIYPDVIREFGWTREQATLLASAKYLTGAVIAIVIGRFIDVVGVRRVLIVVSTAGGIALLSFLWTPGLAAYYVAGVMLGIAGAGTMVSIKVLISRTFHESQGTAMGIAMLGTSIGTVVVPIAITYLIETFGWRAGTAMLSAGVWLVALPLMIFFLNDSTFDGDSPPLSDATGLPATVSLNAAGELMKKSQFWMIAVAVFAVGFVDQAFIQHQVLYLRNDLGLSAAYVATGISAIGLVGIVVRPLVGAVFDRWSVSGVRFVYYLLSLGCLVALSALNPYVFAAFVVLRAIGHAAVLLDTTVLAKHTFGLANIGVILGVLTAAVNLGFAAGPWFVARMYANTGSYGSAFMICAVVGVMAALVLLPVKPTYWLQQRYFRYPIQPVD